VVPESLVSNYNKFIGDKASLSNCPLEVNANPWLGTATKGVFGRTDKYELRKRKCDRGRIVGFEARVKTGRWLKHLVTLWRALARYA
jgi:hypothetical protein